MSTPTPQRPYAKWYGTGRWKRLAYQHRKMNPLCVMCKEHGVIMAADVVDHIVPHRGDAKLFWDPANLQSMCKPHHDSSKAQLEHKGFVDDIGTDGFPVDENHPFNRKRKWSDD